MYNFRPATREGVSLIIGIAGSSGSGKTLSALLLGRGLVGGAGKMLVADTESGRALHYAPPPGLSDEDVRAGERAGKWMRFDHYDFRAPFSPQRYLEVIQQSEAAGYGAIIFDSWSHSWNGEGGLHDQQELEMQRLIKDANDRAQKYNRAPDSEAFLREKLNSASWTNPKVTYKEVIGKILQARIHIIFAMRAEEKLQIKQEKDERGRNRTVYISAADRPPAERWIPICCHNPELMYELTCSMVMSPASPGMPIPIKLQKQHAHAFPERTNADGELVRDRVSEESGRLLAEWARGANGAQPQTQTKSAETRAGDTKALFVVKLRTREEPYATVDEWRDRLVAGVAKLTVDQAQSMLDLNAENLAAYAEKWPEQASAVSAAFRQKIMGDDPAADPTRG